MFSIASQILPRDPTRSREETNLTTLLLEDGLITAHDLIPQSGVTAGHFYSGGGASMFQRRLLHSLLASAVYSPFYWEDVEWGWRARCRHLLRHPPWDGCGITLRRYRTKNCWDDARSERRRYGRAQSRARASATR